MEHTTVSSSSPKGDTCCDARVRDVLIESLAAVALRTSYSPTEDIKIRRDVIAQLLLRRWPADTIITRELYDADDDFGDCLLWLNPHFEFPTWHGRSVGEYLSRYGDSRAADRLNVLEFSVPAPEQEVRARHITLAQLLAAAPLAGEGVGWRVPPGFDIWFL